MIRTERPAPIAAPAAGHVEADGFVVGSHVDRHLALDESDRCVDEAGMRIEHRFAT